MTTKGYMLAVALLITAGVQPPALVEPLVLHRPSGADVTLAHAKRKPRLVLTVSEGNRPWFVNITRERLERYAVSMQADFSVVGAGSIDVPQMVVEAWTKYPVGEVSHDKGIRNNTAYVIKMLAIAHALESYERVLWLDDTVYPTKNARSIFDECGATKAVCAYSEAVSGRSVEAKTYANTLSFLFRFSNNSSELCPAESYVNTGVTVFGQSSRPLLSPAALAAGMPYFGVGIAVEQCYLCVALAQSRSASVQLLGHEWNHVPYYEYGDVEPAAPFSQLGNGAPAALLEPSPNHRLLSILRARRARSERVARPSCDSTRRRHGRSAADRAIAAVARCPTLPHHPLLLDRPRPGGHHPPAGGGRSVSGCRLCRRAP